MAMSGDGIETAEPQFVDSITQAIQVSYRLKKRDASLLNVHDLLFLLGP